MRRRPVGDVCNATPRPEPHCRVEPMDARVCSTALHQYVVTIDRPCMRQGGLHDSLAVTPPPELRVADNILKKAVPSAFTQQVRRGDEHARRGNAIAVVGDEHVGSLLGQGISPDALGALMRLRRSTHLRHFKQSQERRQVGGAREPSSGHGKHSSIARDEPFPRGYCSHHDAGLRKAFPLSRACSSIISEQ